MFTVKYRQFTLAPAQQADAPMMYSQVESIDGPFDRISQEHTIHGMVVYAYRGDGELHMTYGPCLNGREDPPRPTVWVMNEMGATVAKYDL